MYESYLGLMSPDEPLLVLDTNTQTQKQLYLEL